MAITRLAYVNQAVQASTVITASSALTNRPASFLASPARWKKWRSATGTGDQNALFTFSGSVTIKVVAIVDYKRHTGGAIRAEYWDGAAYQVFGTFVIPASNPTRVLAVWNTAGVATTRIRIYFTNTGAANDYVELGVCVAADYVEPARALDVNFRMRVVDPSVVVASVDGQDEVQTRTMYRIAEGLFKSGTEAALSAFRTVLDSIGSRAPLLFAADVAVTDQVLYGRLEGDLPYPYCVNGDYWEFPARVMELR